MRAEIGGNSLSGLGPDTAPRGFLIGA